MFDSEVASILLWLYYEVFSSIIEGAIQIEKEYTSDRIYSSLDLSLGLWLVKFQQALRAKLFSLLMRGKNSRTTVLLESKCRKYMLFLILNITNLCLN